MRAPASRVDDFVRFKRVNMTKDISKLVNHIVRTLTVDAVWLGFLFVFLTWLTFKYPIVQTVDRETVHIRLMQFSPSAILLVMLTQKSMSLLSWRKARREMGI